MKKNLLLTAALACGIGLSASAENTITVFNNYFDEKTQSNELLTGCFYSVSPNGKFAVGFDQGTMDYVTYIWSAETGKIEVAFECSYEEEGPFGAKSIGEVVINTPLPSIADAIFTIFFSLK